MNRRKRGIGGLAAVAASSATILGGLFATSGAAFAATPASSNWTATSTPNIYPGATDQPAGNWTFTLGNTYTADEILTVLVGPNGTTSCQSSSDFVGFATTPTVTVKADSANTGTSDATPNITVTTATQSTDGTSCKTAGVKDELDLTITNAAGGVTTDSFDVTVSGVQYNVGAGTPASAGGSLIGTAGSDLPGTTAATPAPLTIDPNAKLQPVRVTANTPPVGIVAGTSKTISNVVIAEALPGQVTGAPVTVALDDTGDTLVPSPVTITATNAMIGATATSTPSATVTETPKAGDTSLSFYVLTPSTVAPATFTISGMTVAANIDNSGPASIDITYNNTDTLTTVAYAVIGVTRTAGYSVDDTAEAAFQNGTDGGYNIYRYPAGIASSCFNFGSGYGTGLGYAVLASDITPYDALSGNFLAGTYGTGVLLTPQNALSNDVANIVHRDGIGTVFLLGGTDAISQAVQTALANTQAYCWNDGSPVPETGSTGAPVNVQVIRIAGTTADETSSLIAQYNGPDTLGGEQGTPGAYGTMYNDTTGTASSSGPTAGTGTGNCYECFRTAVVATTSTFQDALASGPLSYSDGVPVVLTPQSGLSPAATASLVNLGIQQVYLMGGPGALSNQVTTDIQNLGISVLRIAGLTYSDTAQMLARFAISNTVPNSSPAVQEGLDVFGDTPNSNGQIGSARGDSFGDALTSASQLYYYSNGDFTPLLLTQDTNNAGAETLAFLNDAGNTHSTPAGIDGTNVFQVQVFGGTLAQTPALVQSEINALAAG